MVVMLGWIEDGDFEGETVWIADCRYKTPNESRIKDIHSLGRMGDNIPRCNLQHQ